MARPRGQDGYIEPLRGNRWKAHWYIYERVESQGAVGDIRRHRSKTLGRMTKGEATAQLREIIARECGAIGEPSINGNARVTFSWFWTKQFVPLRVWSKHTRANMESLFANHIEPRWGAVPLAEIEGPAVAEWLTDLASKYSSSLVGRARTYMKAALEEAVEEEYLRKNPMRRVSLPEVREVSRPVATLAMLKKVRAQLKLGNPRDVVMFDVVALAGVRPSEMLALRWEFFRGRELYIANAYVEGEMRRTKTTAAKAWVAIPARLAREIEAWRRRCPSDEWMFPNEIGQPIRLDNWRKRAFAPAVKAAKVKLDLRTLRRSWATWAHNAGASMKSVQAQLRHSSVATTGNVYVQSVPETVKKAVEGVARGYYAR